MTEFNRVGNAWEFRAAGYRLRLTLDGLKPGERMTEEEWLTANDAAEAVFDDDPGRHENLLRGLRDDTASRDCQVRKHQEKRWSTQ